MSTKQIRGSEFVTMQAATTPHLPLSGSIDLTYRCNNNCRHCWLHQPDTPKVRERELSFQEWITVIDQARAMGTRKWAISGGEPMLREDFSDLFDFITSKSIFYSLNTNGTLITPAIARRLSPGDIMIALYGANPAIHDHITRNPGSFDQALQGMAYLREAGVRYTVQIVPMKDNFHQWEEMHALAQRLSPDYRIGTTWMHLSASGDMIKNREIIAQRLTPAQAVSLDPPNVPYEQRHQNSASCCAESEQNSYRNCITNRNSFHIDPFGSMSFCSLVKDERLRYDLVAGSFAEGWDLFLPGLAADVENFRSDDPACRSCSIRYECRACPALKFLESRSLADTPSYICRIELEKSRLRADWKAEHQRFFKLAGISIAFNSELPIKADSFGPRFNSFYTDAPGEDLVQVEHYYSIPQHLKESHGELLYDSAPWRIYKKDDLWYYVNFTGQGTEYTIHKVAVFSKNYAHSRIFSESERFFHAGDLHSLTMFATDQIWLSQVLLSRRALYVHSCGLNLDGRGMLFIGHSGAGKSTTAKLFGAQAELLCDDRNIVRFWPELGWRVHGTWNHGELPRVSSNSASLEGLFFLEHASENRLIRIHDRGQIIRRLIPCLVRPFVNAHWWQEILPMVQAIANEVPAYIMHFDLSGAIVPLVRDLDFKKTQTAGNMAVEAELHHVY